MYTFEETPPHFQELNARSKEQIRGLLQHLKPVKTGYRLQAPQPLYTDAKNEPFIYLLTEGHMKCERAERLLFVYDEGDLLALEQLFWQAPIKVYSEFDVVLDLYDREAFLKAVQGDATRLGYWTGFLAAQLDLYGAILSTALRKEVKGTPTFRNYQAGEVIIEQGSLGKNVFILAEGAAEVFVNGTKVGEILRDETFGIFAAVTGTPRTATVKATRNCIVIDLSTESFQEIIETRPASVLRMLENMTRIILDLNQRVLTLSK